MRYLFAMTAGLIVAVGSQADADTGRSETRRALAEKIAARISNPDQRVHAEAMLNPKAVSLDSALVLIQQSRSPSARVALLRKLAKSSKHKSIFTRSLTASEVRKLHESIGPVVDQSEESGAALLAMLYANLNLDRPRMAASVRLIQNTPAGRWKDAICFQAIYVLTVRKHPATELRGSSLPLNAKSVPECFLTDCVSYLKQLKDERFREYAHGLIALSTLHRGDVEKALTHVEKIKSPNLRDMIHFQAVSVLLTERVDREHSVSVSLSADQLKRLTISRQ